MKLQNVSGNTCLFESKHEDCHLNRPVLDVDTHTQKLISNSPRQPNQTSNIPHSVLDPLVGIGVEELLMFANLSTDSTTTIQRLLQLHT